MLPAVLLIGDSIRAGYQPYAAAAMDGSADVNSGADYGGTSARIRANLDAWLQARRYDLVHLNCGLHDLARRPGTEPNVPLAEYRDNLQAIFARLAELGMPALWASTTPVDEVRHHRNKPFDRLEADVTAYNAAALEIAREHGLVIDDLYGRAVAGGWTRHLTDDGVHFTAEGYRLLGGAVADAVTAPLDRLGG